MTETEVLRALCAIKAKRESDARTLALLRSVSLPPAEDLEAGINQLRSQLKMRSGEDAWELYIEDALQTSANAEEERRIATDRLEPRQNGSHGYV
jgi:hypothetical protein